MNIQLFNFSVDLFQAILWQYNDATRFLTLVREKQQWVNTNSQDFWINWYNNVFNLLTANAFGISVWSYILNVPLYINAPVDPDDKPVFGFNQYDPTFPTLLNTYLNFGNSNFSTKGQILALTIEEQRFLLRLRYFQLTTRGDVTDVNKFLNYLVTTSSIGFTGRLYMLDGLNMTITYVFTTADFPSDLLEVIQILDLLPRPAGVGIKYHINYGKQFGFNAFSPSFPNYENTNQNFGNGNLVAPF